MKKRKQRIIKHLKIAMKHERPGMIFTMLEFTATNKIFRRQIREADEIFNKFTDTQVNTINPPLIVNNLLETVRRVKPKLHIIGVENADPKTQQIAQAIFNHQFGIK